jgi:hypothetical protein
MDDVNFAAVLNREDTKFEDKLRASRGLQ